MMIIIRIDNRTRLTPLRNLPGGVLARIKRRLTFINPAFLEAEKRGFWTGNMDQEIKGYQVDSDTLVIPRGFTRQLVMILHQAGVQCRIDDCRRTLASVDFSFKGELRDFQVEALEAVASRDFGVLQAPTGSGKTVVTLALVARRGQPALIVVHTRELLNQWVDRIGTFLGIPARKVGVIGGGKKRIGEKITLGLVQTLYRVAGEVAPRIGNLIVDEAHRCPSRTFTEAVSAFDCRYMTGLSATPWRRDGLSRLIYWHLGNKVHEVDKAAMVEAGHILQADVIWRETNFEPYYDPSTEYSQMLSELTEDPVRNALIADDVAREAGNGGGVILILSDRKWHVKRLAALLEGRKIEAAVLTGDLRSVERARVVEALNAGRIKVVVATGQLIGEGFDCRELSTLFLATPIKFSGRLLQYLGRVLRPAPGKDRAIVYDFQDVNVPVLMAATRSRQRIYDQTGE
jgi:superfamily II DNA or RNA helicase